MNYDEVLFIWAEAAQRGLIDGGQALAEEMYYKATVDGVHPTDLGYTRIIEHIESQISRIIRRGGK